MLQIVVETNAKTTHLDRIMLAAPKRTLIDHDGMTETVVENFSA